MFEEQRKNQAHLIFHTHDSVQSVMQIIKPAVLHPGPFLMAHLLKDMEQLSRALGKGVDDTVNTIHLTIHSLLEPHQTSQCKSSHNSPYIATNCSPASEIQEM